MNNLENNCQFSIGVFTKNAFSLFKQKTASRRKLCKQSSWHYNTNTLSTCELKKWKTTESGLARQREVWIVGSKFEKMCIQKFNAHRISPGIIFVDFLLKVLSII